MGKNHQLMTKTMIPHDKKTKKAVIQPILKFQN
jgi:hypothetical protein